ncbi:DNA mismatch repair protein MutT [Pseudoxanthomonas broegbernensis]|uniref:GDP-mannose pyrophosphatase n=1 Tax=Pseudoxanthomonas broegbernensis TaxID=83619 RepID=A0A7V8K7D8_9GAMM|nr:NUDIX hydrolase [Pseudoxanthomonas broegbernensis]KAF1686439.1 DNA mismatch repair protein MutT [Pseudoxanthomonas broegbernensis]MBB6064309.1 ADP-ribose pyrophosphatase [Pseudoxanthomonas broegbernensis]
MDRSSVASDAPHVVYEGRYQRMVVRGHWEYSERTHPGGLAAIIVAVTPDDRVLFVEQFRIPLQARTIEMPAGLVGDVNAGESIEESAIRELEEETGWTAERAQVLMVGPTSSGASSEKIAFVRASGLRKIGPGGGDASEDISVHEVPRAQAAAWLARKLEEGYELDAKLWAGLWMIDHNLDGSAREP